MIDEPPQELTNPIGAKIKIIDDFEGLVFEAKAVDGDFVAAKIIERDSWGTTEKDLVISLNTRRYNVWVLSREYAECIMRSRGLVDINPNVLDSAKDSGFPFPFTPDISDDDLEELMEGP